MTERRHVVVVDDQADIRDTIGEYLALNGYRVTAVDGGPALRALAEREPIDLVVLDLAMPGEDGLSLARWLRGRGHVGIVILTARDAVSDRVLGIETGADDYLTKPVDLRELLARVGAVMRRARRAEPVPAASDPRPAEQDTLVVIADISGYTRFMALNRLALPLAQHAIGRLMRAVVDAATPLRLEKLEGDAVMLSGEDVALASLSDALVRMVDAFYRCRNGLVGRGIEALDLKIVVHRGRVLRYAWGAGSEIGGMPVIVAHRLLKNTVGLHRYVLVTEEVGPLALPLGFPCRPHREMIADIGEVTTMLHAFEPPGEVMPAGAGEDTVIAGAAVLAAGRAAAGR